MQIDELLKVKRSSPGSSDFHTQKITGRNLSLNSLVDV